MKPTRKQKEARRRRAITKTQREIFNARQHAENVEAVRIAAVVLRGDYDEDDHPGFFSYDLQPVDADYVRAAIKGAS